ncbi:MAG: YbjP/YqhG family protein [Pyrinomonadaceae bacterium]|nr:YbjP/YqhG family protein [Pyrinomonadaceae bacterium]
MKKGFYKYIGFTFLLAVLLCGNAFAQSSSPEATAKEFYKWYLTELNASREPRDQKAEMTKYVSKRLYKWMSSKAYEEYGADYIIDGQDYNEDWVKGITTTKAVVKGNTATFKIMLTPPKGSENSTWKHTLSLKLVKENGTWKIDSVNNRALLS